jgi:hypothetical protein
MKTKTPRKLVFGIAALCIAVTVGLVVHIGVQAQDGSARYFEETGLNVSGPFLQFFDAHGGASLFGYPLTGPSGRCAVGARGAHST